jgi:hypothetical protein
VLERIELDRDELLRRFNLSRRMTARIGALISKGIAFTAGVLEQAPPGSPMESLLTSEAFLNAVPTMKTVDFPAMAQAMSLSVQRLVTQEAGGSVTVALEEEVLAEEGFKSVRRTQEASSEYAIDRVVTRPLATAADTAAPFLIGQNEARSLFPPDEISRIKLTLLTSVDPRQKMEVIRKLTYAPISADDKALLFLKALSDPAAEVRKEAAIALRSMGLNPDIAQFIISMSGAEPRQKQVLAEGLKSFAANATPAERTMIVAILLSEMRGDKTPQLESALIDALTDLADSFAGNAEFVTGLTRLVAERLAMHFAEVHTAVRRLYEALGRISPDMLTDLLWREMLKLEEKRIRAYFLILLMNMHLPAGKRQDVAVAAVSTISDWADTDIDCRRLGYSLRLLGDAAAVAIIEGFEKASDTQQSFFVHLLDELVMSNSVSEETFPRLGRFIADILSSARRQLRVAILDTRIAFSAAFPIETRREIAGHLLAGMRDSKLDRTVELTDIAIRRIGPAAIPVLLRAMAESPYGLERECAVRLLGDIIRECRETSPEIAADAASSIRDLGGLLKGDFLAKGLVVVALGKVLGTAFASGELRCETTSTLRNMLGKSEHSFEILEALGWIASGADTALPLKLEIGGMLLDFMESRLPEDFAKETHTKEGLLLELSPQTRMYTELLPTLIKGIERICLSKGNSPHLQERLTGGLLQKWNQLIAYEVVWGPVNVIRLAETLGNIACSDDTAVHMRSKIIEALSRKLLNTSIIRIVGDALGHEVESSSITAHSGRIARELLGLATDEDFQDWEDRQLILAALGKICARAAVAPEANEADTIRRQILDLLFHGLSEDIPGTRDSLKGLSKSANLPEKTKKAIAERLGK